MRNRLLALFLATFPQSAFGAIIYESATGNNNSIYGPSIAYYQFLGSRFTLHSSTQITGIGGTFSDGHDTIFGAILNMPGVLPQGSPFNPTEVLLSTLFAPTNRGDDIAPVSITLPAGNYAVVFGSGQFGAIGGAGMPPNGTDTPAGAGSYFYWGTTNSWYMGDFSNVRFIITGTVPEPNISALAILGCFAIGVPAAAGSRRTPYAARKLSRNARYAADTNPDNDGQRATGQRMDHQRTY